MGRGDAVQLASAPVQNPQQADAGVVAASSPGPKVALLTGGFDKPYAFGLTMALAGHGCPVEVIGSDDVDSPEMHTTPGVTFLNLRGSKEEAGLAAKVRRVLTYYGRLMGYAHAAQPAIFHILWNNKFQLFDRTLLMLYYRFLGKKIVLTAHNVNAGKRDANDSALNRASLRVQYRLCDHIFVHTEQMKRELQQEFALPGKNVTVIPFGINNSVPNTELTPEQAKHRLGIGPTEKTVLFFGAIRAYKGLEYLVDAFLQLAPQDPAYRLIIAGFPKDKDHWDSIRRKIGNSAHSRQVVQHIEYIPDEDTEVYFKAADVVALPYTHVFQSGVLFLAYSFGTPVIATDVGSIAEEVVDGKTGFLCQPCDGTDMARQMKRYFESELYRYLDERRQSIRQFASASHSWKTVAERTCNVYAALLEESR